MNTQPEALRLADLLDSFDVGKVELVTLAVIAELRRLHEVNAELVEALKDLIIEADKMYNSRLTNPIWRAQAAIRIATGEQT
jgi:hypothetical protein